MSGDPCLWRLYGALGIKTEVAIRTRGSPARAPILIRPELYEDSSSILFLSDGISQPELGHESLGAELSRMFPAKKVVSADFEYAGDPGSGNYRKVSLDNTRPFAFPDNSFETIVLRNGLCVCNGRASCCGGFFPSGPEMQRFFSEVVRVLDKTKPHSRIVLHGNDVNQRGLQLWNVYLREVEIDYGVRARIHFESSGQARGTAFIEITPDPDRP